MAIRLGDIRFLNSWPVTYALRKGIIPSDVQMVSGTPAELNRKLLTGELDASAVSSILYLRHLEEFVPILKFCIRSESGVHSVLVVSRQPLEKLVGKKIGVSNEGATTPVLLKLLLHQRKLKISLEVTSLRYPKILEEYPAALLIGDEALEASQSAEAPGAASTSRSHDPSVHLKVIAEISRAIGTEGMIGGQVADIETSDGATVSAATLEAINIRKTGALIAASVRTGALLGQARPAQYQALSRYGERVGLVFQLVDDLLDRDGVVRCRSEEVVRRRAEQLTRLAIQELQPLGRRADPLRMLAQFILTRES